MEELHYSCKDLNHERIIDENGIIQIGDQVIMNASDISMIDIYTKGRPKYNYNNYYMEHEFFFVAHKFNTLVKINLVLTSNGMMDHDFDESSHPIIFIDDDEYTREDYEMMSNLDSARMKAINEKIIRIWKKYQNPKKGFNIT